MPSVRPKKYRKECVGCHPANFGIESREEKRWRLGNWWFAAVADLQMSVLAEARASAIWRRCSFRKQRTGEEGGEKKSVGEET